MSEREPLALRRSLVLLLAVAVGSTVANLYYVQPLLNVIADDLGISHTAAGLLVTCAQLGYVGGLALIVPLGDLRERSRLVTVLLGGAGVALAVSAAAPSFAVLAAALVAVGTLSCVTQILVPLAATLAAPGERGTVVGSVMSGLLIGILAARVVAGAVAQAGGWRLMFALAAGLMVLLAFVLRRALPRLEAVDPMPYPRALGTVIELIAAEPILRQRMALAFFQMAGFSVLWTSLAFLLGGEPYNYDEAVIGLFGLAGVAGAIAASAAGRLADAGRGGVALTGSLLAVLVSWGLLAAGATSLVALIAGIVLLDLGVQGAQISNQTRIYALAAEARSRLTTAYMVALFAGGVLGSTLSASVYGAAGWGATCALGAGLALCGLAIWAATERAHRRTDEFVRA